MNTFNLEGGGLPITNPNELGGGGLLPVTPSPTAPPVEESSEGK